MCTPPRLPTIGFSCARLLRLLLSTLHLHRTTGFREVVSFPPPGFYNQSVSDMVQCSSSTRQLRQPLTSLAFASFCGCFYLKPSAPSIRLTKWCHSYRTPHIFDQPKHPSVLLITAPYRFTASLPYSSSRHVAYPTLHAHKRPVVASDEADKLSHVLHVLASLARAVCCFHHTNRIVVPLNLTSCALQSKPELPLNFAFPCSKLPTPCDFAWLCWCGLTFNLPKLWTGLLLRPPELGLSAHRRYPFPGPVRRSTVVGPVTPNHEIRSATIPETQMVCLYHSESTTINCCIVRLITVQSRSVSASSVRHPELPSFFDEL